MRNKIMWFTWLMACCLMAGCGGFQPENIGSTSQELTTPFVQITSDTPGSGSSVKATMSKKAQVAGDTNACAIGWWNATTSIKSFTDTSGNAYTLAGCTVDSTAPATTCFYYCIGITAAAAGKNSITVAWPTSVPSPDLRCAEYSSIVAFDSWAGAFGNSSLNSSGNLTTTASNDVIIGANYLSNNTDGPGTGFTSRLITSDSDIYEDELSGAPGSYSATAPSGDGWWVMQAVAFRTTFAGDGGVDSGSDASDAAGTKDSSSDASDATDSSIDASDASDANESGVDSSTDAITDATTDATTDASNDAPNEASNDSPSEASDATSSDGSENDATEDANEDSGQVITPALLWHVSGSNTRGMGYGAQQGFCIQTPLAQPAVAGTSITCGWVNNTSTPDTVVSDDKGDTYTVETYIDSADTASMGIAHAYNVSAGARVISVCGANDPGTYSQVVCTEFANVLGIDVSAGNSGSGTTITASTLTPSASGELYYQVAFQIGAAQTTFTPTLIALSLDDLDGFAAQYSVVNSNSITGTIGTTATGRWITYSALLKVGATGSVPSGSRIVHIWHENIPSSPPAGGTGNPLSNPTTLQFPSTGNLLVSVIGGGNNNLPATVDVSSITDGVNTWSFAAPAINGGDPSAQILYAPNVVQATSTDIMWTTTQGDETDITYDIIGASNSPLDNAVECSGGQDNSSSTLEWSCTLSVAGSGEWVFAGMPVDFGTIDSLTGGYSDACFAPGEVLNGPLPLDENNGWGHLITTSSPVSFTWGKVQATASGSWVGVAAAFH